jgi:xanthosine utilization system XapX-like protein
MKWVNYTEKRWKRCFVGVILALLHAASILSQSGVLGLVIGKSMMQVISGLLQHMPQLGHMIWCELKHQLKHYWPIGVCGGI